MLFIYIKEVTHRAEYIFRHIFEECLKMPYRLSDNLAEAPDDEVILNYSDEDPGKDRIDIRPHSILFHSGTEALEIDPIKFNGHTVFFKTGDNRSGLPYDPFALCFFMLSRYEEYLSFERDRHGRFPVGQSVACLHQFLEEPVVDHAIEDLRLMLEERFDGLQLFRPDFKVQLSYDVDAPFAWRSKGFARNVGGGLALLMRGKFKEGLQRIGALMSSADDPFDIFDELLTALERSGQDADFFLLLEHRGKHNPTVDYKDPLFMQIVSNLKKSHRLGLHPSYNCVEESAFKTESGRFEELCSYAPTVSRQHFIRLNIPETYELLESNGILEDHSMSFPESPGFRAGTSMPFTFYNLSKEKESNLRVHPFCLMDATFEYYRIDGSIDDIWGEFMKLAERIQSVGGNMNVVFHNNLISNYVSNCDWKSLHAKLLSWIDKA